ncbi:MAG: phosphoribosylamine--glycine ligase [SAR202 cluster bacterium]|nr:phosphoribosylamine--glycine ligase [SAR202 cluster bacterium]
MKVLVIGSGAREHALAWKLSKSPKITRVFVAPGNGGTDSFAVNLPISADDINTLFLLATRYNIDLTVVGPETPLAQGIVDRFEQAGLAIWGPTRDAARIESSKAFARELMTSKNIPSPDYKIFKSYSDGYQFLSKHEGPVVIKADGLAAGKGVMVCRDREAAINALYDCMEDRVFGAAGTTVVVEEFLEGQEVSVFAFSDGQHISSLVAACDYKRLLDGNRGPNTGGMGSFTPTDFWTPEFKKQVCKEIIEPAIKGLAESGSPYKGVLYAGLMVTPSGPKVLEYNCRLGDPETQVLMPLLKNDLVDVISATLDGKLHKKKLEWEQRSCVGVVLTSRGYPGEYRRGIEITGLRSLDKEVFAFHAGTTKPKGDHTRVVTSGGRVLTIVSAGETITEARDKVYDNVRRVDFKGCHYRKDIAMSPDDQPVTKGQKTS